jgi:hypothetical protein
MKKIYKVQIDNPPGSGTQMWYRNKVGETYDTTLGIRETEKGNNVPVFVLSGPPFFHIYPNHCKIVGEKIIKSNL